MVIIAITAYSEMDNTRTANESESSSSEARMARLERMMELIVERLDQQQNQQPPPPPPAVPEQNVNVNDGDIIALTHKFSKMKPPSFQGGLEPLKAEAWVLETENLFEVFRAQKHIKCYWPPLLCKKKPEGGGCLSVMTLL